MLRFQSFNSKSKLKELLRLAMCSGLFTISACNLPKLQTPEVGPTLPASFNQASSTSENSSQTSAMEYFNDPKLSKLLVEAITENQELKLLEQEIQIANNEIRARTGAYLPFVTVGGGLGVEKTSRYTRNGAVEEQLNILDNRRFPNPLPDFLVAANFSWQLDIWRQLRNARDAATLRYLGTAEGRNYVITRIIAEVAENYYSLMALDNRLDNLKKTIELQKESLKQAEAKKEAGRGTELPVQRFQAEIQKNESEILVVNQEIIEVENRLNFLLGRYPKPIERNSSEFYNLSYPAIALGVPSELLKNRPDIRQAEREVEASGLDVKVARANFFPSLILTGGIGLQAFNPKYLVTTPEALVANAAGNLVAPLINRRAIEADYLSANARQIQALVNYQRVVLNAYIEVVNQFTKAENYRKSVALKKRQLESLEASVETATKLFLNARAEYVEVLLAQRDMLDARMDLIETKRQELIAVARVYQALGGGTVFSNASPMPIPQPQPPAPPPQ
jgi:NodT family efflux transporter outer membrane factor (OMF) lipoprotein